MPAGHGPEQLSNSKHNAKLAAALAVSTDTPAARASIK